MDDLLKINQLKVLLLLVESKWAILVFEIPWMALVCPFDVFSSWDNSSMGVVTRITPGGIEKSSSSDSEFCLHISAWLTSASWEFNSVDVESGEGTAKGGGAGVSPWWTQGAKRVSHYAFHRIKRAPNTRHFEYFLSQGKCGARVTHVEEGRKLTIVLFSYAIVWCMLAFASQ